MLWLGLIVYVIIKICGDIRNQSKPFRLCLGILYLALSNLGTLYYKLKIALIGSLRGCLDLARS